MPNEIGNRLLDERERLGLSQTALANLCQVTMRSQRNYEKGERMPDAAYLAAVAVAGADVLYILTGRRSGAMPAEPQLAPDEAALLDNYRHSPPDAQAALKATSDAFAKSAKGRKRA